MIADTARYHGSFFALLLEHFSEPITLQRLKESGSGCYLVNGVTPIGLKMSSRRLGPWTFNFAKSHQESYEKLFQSYGDFYACLVCGRDGIVGLSMQELRLVLDEGFEEQGSVTVRRGLKTMYQVSGRDGVLGGRISRHSIFDKIRNSISRGGMK